MSYLLDCVELADEFGRFDPIYMERWAQLLRGSKAQGKDSTRRSWERFRTWLRNNEAPVDMSEFDAEGVAKPIFLLAGFREWVELQEQRWSKSDDR